MQFCFPKDKPECLALLRSIIFPDVSVHKKKFQENTSFPTQYPQALLAALSCPDSTVNSFTRQAQ